MVNLVSKVAIVGVVLVAVLYQFLVKNIIFNIMGYGRPVLSLKEFKGNVQCQRIDDLGLEACEDMWLHEKTGFLYMACASSLGRAEWNPAISHFNVSGRGMKDHITVLDTRGKGPVSSRLQRLSLENFSGNNGDGVIDLLGIDILADKNSDTLRILLVNHRPPFDPITGEALDPALVGANSTIEQFTTKAGNATMRHVRTYADPLIGTPNNVAWVNDHAFVFTNDHSSKVGFRRELEQLLGGGSVGYCDRTRCNIAWNSGLNFPNGLVKGRDGLIYVPSSLDLHIDVFSLGEDHKLKQVDRIKIGMPLDNLSVDNKGDIYAAVFPQIYKFIKTSTDPFLMHPPTAVIKITRGGKDYEGSGRKGHLEHEKADYHVEKVLEDDGSVLPCSSIAVHDDETGRFFLGGPVSPYIAICETR